jgi:sialate O-acetylesterase
MTMRFAMRGTALAVFLGGVAPVMADVKLPAIFGDHMVLQQDTKLPVWGTADAGEKVKVTLGDRSGEATAGDDGKWQVDLPATPTSAEPLVLTVEGKNKIEYKDVLVGDVWVCSGQSNMEWSVQSSHNAATTKEKATDGQIRFFRIPHIAKIKPQDDVIGKWEVCAPETVTGFSAVGYFFGKDLRAEFKRPIGLIQSAWGGTPAQSWTPIEGLRKDAELKGYVESHENSVANFDAAMAKFPAEEAKYKEDLAVWEKEVGAKFAPILEAWKKEAAAAKAANQPVPEQPKPEKAKPSAPKNPHGGGGSPAALYNGMIAPLIPYAIKGAIWYQGESNAGNAAQYKVLFGRMITEWREKWGQGNFPFLFVQLAAFGKNTDNDTWPDLRESQRKTLELPATGMAVALDIGDAIDIHPRDKEDVGRRLALAARHVAYGQELVYSGPVYESVKIDGNKAVVNFTHTGGGLIIGSAPWVSPTAKALPTDKLLGFQIAGEDNKWVDAEATIEGNTVVVTSAQVEKPAAVRYGWLNTPEVNLYNKEGLPAGPFNSTKK